GGFWAGARRDDAGAVGTDQAGLAAGHRAFHADHVTHRNAFGDRDHEIEAGVDALENGITGEGRRHEHRRRLGAGLLHGFGDGVEYRHLLAAVLKELAAFSGGDPGDDLRTVVDRQLRVPRAKGAGDALNDDAGGFGDE